MAFSRFTPVANLLPHPLVVNSCGAKFFFSPEHQRLQKGPVFRPDAADSMMPVRFPHGPRRHSGSTIKYSFFSKKNNSFVTVLKLKG